MVCIFFIAASAPVQASTPPLREVGWKTDKGLALLLLLLSIFKF